MSELDELDQAIAETDAVAELLIFIEEEADDGQLLRLRPPRTAMLYIARDKLRLAQVSIGRLNAMALLRPV